MQFNFITILLFAGALAAGGTLLHTFALAVDEFFADVGSNSAGSLTLSSYAAISARKGNPGYSMAVGFLMFSWPPVSLWFKTGWKPYLLMHGEDAMVADLARTCASAEKLLAGDPKAMVLIAALRQRAPSP